MEGKDFKVLFDKAATNKGFKKAFGFWYKEAKDCMIVLDLQKSNYGKYFDLNFKVFIQGVFNTKYEPSKKNFADTGDIFIRQPAKFNDILNLELQIENETRINHIECLFDEFVIPYSLKCSSLGGIIEMANQESLYLLPAIREEIHKIIES